MTQVLRYPAAALYGDYARAGAGLALTALPLALLAVNPWVGVPLGAAAALFAAFAARTAQRHATRLLLDEGGLTLDGPLGGALRWDELRDLRLAYYSTKRDRSDGWMQATLRGARGRRLRIESTLDGFDAVIERAAAAARDNGLTLSSTTVDNLLALGIDVPEPASGPGEEGR